jgi:hypothetical protein
MPENPVRSPFTTLIVGVGVLAVVTVLAMVLVFSFAKDTTMAVAMAGLISGVTVPIIGFLLIGIKTEQNRERIEETSSKVNEVGVKVDGRLEELLQLTAKSQEAIGRAAGLIEGRTAGMKEEQALNTARQEPPH